VICVVNVPRTTEFILARHSRSKLEVIVNNGQATLWQLQRIILAQNIGAKSHLRLLPAEGHLSRILEGLPGELKQGKLSRVTFLKFVASDGEKYRVSFDQSTCIVLKVGKLATSSAADGELELGHVEGAALAAKLVGRRVHDHGSLVVFVV
jgi:hypothetical protein